jgi:hypothetical protein
VDDDFPAQGNVRFSLLTGVSSTPSFTDDAAHTVGTTKTQPMAGTYRSVRDAVDDNDAGTLAMNAKRGLYVTLEAADSTPLALNTGAPRAPRRCARSLPQTALRSRCSAPSPRRHPRRIPPRPA